MSSCNRCLQRRAPPAGEELTTLKWITDTSENGKSGQVQVFCEDKCYTIPAVHSLVHSVVGQLSHREMRTRWLERGTNVDVCFWMERIRISGRVGTGRT